MPESPTPDQPITAADAAQDGGAAVASPAVPTPPPASCVVTPTTPFEVDAEEVRKVNLYGSFRDLNRIDPAHYERHDVKRGLRNADGTGVVVGMTNISNVHGYVICDGEKQADEGSLRFRGYDL